MSDRGVFALDRGLFDHPIFSPEPYTEREAWIWMLSAAAWSDRRVRIGKTMIDLKRGQLVFATRFLAAKWQWSHSKVVRFLNRLKIDTMLNTEPKRDATLITICNYNEYQFGRNADETQNETPTETQAERQRNKEEESNNLRTNNLGGEEAPEETIVPIRQFVFEGGIIRLNQKSFDRWRKAYHAIPDFASALQAADDYYVENPPKDGKWFFPVSRWLEKQHTVEFERQKTARTAGRSW